MDYVDRDLVAAAKAGDTAAFDQLISRHQERVFATAYHMLSNTDDAADVQQEVFVRAWTHLRGFRGESSFATWLTRIAVNACIGRRRRPRCLSLEDEARALERGPDQTDQMVDGVVVRQVLAGIPAKHRALLVLREVEGLSIGEVAEVMESSEEAVRKQLWRIRKLFAKLLREHLLEEDQ